jgi:hypothetical protein
MAGVSEPSSPAAATISGDGVSPAASAAASGSPPASAAATAIADDGRRAGSLSRQRTITRSTAGSMSGIRVDGLVEGEESRDRAKRSASIALNAALPVNIS